MSERDPLDSFKDQWQRMDPPSAVRSLEEEDALTQEAVAWMAKGWSQIETPEASIPRRPRALRIRNYSMAIAAALLIGVVTFWTSQQNWREKSKALNLVVSAPDPEVQHLSTDSSSAAQPPLPVKEPVAPLLIANTEDQVQVLSGRVRLTMLRDPGISPESKPTDP